MWVSEVVVVVDCGKFECGYLVLSRGWGVVEFGVWFLNSMIVFRCERVDW